MAILFDRDFGRVWSDGTSPCVFSSLVRVPEKIEMQELAEKKLALIQELRRKFGYVYSILDLHVCPSIPEFVAEYYMSNIVAQQFKAGVEHQAIVQPEEKTSCEIFQRTLSQFAKHPISMHHSFESALEAITEMRSKRLSNGRSYQAKTLWQSWYSRLL